MIFKVDGTRVFWANLIVVVLSLFVMFCTDNHGMAIGQIISLVMYNILLFKDLEIDNE